MLSNDSNKHFKNTAKKLIVKDTSRFNLKLIDFFGTSILFDSIVKACEDICCNKHVISERASFFKTYINNYKLKLYN